MYYYHSVNVFLRSLKPGNVNNVLTVLIQEGEPYNIAIIYVHIDAKFKVMAAVMFCFLLSAPGIVCMCLSEVSHCHFSKK